MAERRKLAPVGPAPEVKPRKARRGFELVSDEALKEATGQPPAEPPKRSKLAELAARARQEKPELAKAAVGFFGAPPAPPPKEVKPGPNDRRPAGEHPEDWPDNTAEPRLRAKPRTVLFTPETVDPGEVAQRIYRYTLTHPEVAATFHLRDAFHALVRWQRILREVLEHGQEIPASVIQSELAAWDASCQDITPSAGRQGPMVYAKYAEEKDVQSADA